MSEGLIDNQHGEIVSITAKLTRHYKASSLELGITMHVVIKDANDLTRANEQMIEHLQREHRTQLERLVASGGGAAPTSAPTAEPLPENVEVDLIEVEHIEVEAKGGKRFYKVFGGRWVKHGVRVWIDPKTVGEVEHLIDFAALPVDKTDVKSKRLLAHVSMNGDKPVKVLQMKPKPIEVQSSST